MSLSLPPDLREIYEEVTSLPEAERSEFLDSRLSEHPDLRVEVERMLEDGPFLERNGEVGHGPVVKSHAEAERRVLPEFIGPYPVLSRLGEGGMGEVFEIENTHLDRSEAVKVLTPTLDGALRDSLAREAKTHASLKHPHIARIYEYQDEPVPFIRMDLVRGTTLASILETNDGPLPLERVLELSEQIADALRAAHEQEITHRDLKPGNIMVTPEGDAVLLDFGIAKLTPPLATPGAEAIDSVGCEEESAASQQRT